jgi:hypothetical protein
MTGFLARAASFVVEPHAATEPRAAAPAGARALVLGSPADAPPFAAALAGALRARERAPAALVCVWGASAPGPSTSGPSTPGPSTSFPSSPGPSTWGPSMPGLSKPGPAAAAPTRGLSKPGPAAAAPTRGPSTPGPSSSLWSAGGARRLAARLAARELEVRAAGRLVWLALPEQAGEAAGVLGRLLGWLDAPIVTVLAGPRSAEHDAVVADHDLVVSVRPAAGGALSEAGADALTALALEGLDGWSLACDPLPAGPARWRARAGLARLSSAHPAVAALGPARRAAG